MLLSAQGDADGQYALGLCYEKGVGVTKDQTEAVKYYRLSAAQGFQLAVDALRRLGL
ncbi:MAG: SEL1-like repeat protein [Lentisphaerae bacterium]|nr:SEL1-like repeat protein [Lentisphaerota bacterium]